MQERRRDSKDKWIKDFDSQPTGKIAELKREEKGKLDRKIEDWGIRHWKGEMKIYKTHAYIEEGKEVREEWGILMTTGLHKQFLQSNEKRHSNEKNKMPADMPRRI